MSILTRILSPFRRAPEPKSVPKAAPELVSGSQTFQVEDGKLSFEAKTLDEFYSKAEAKVGAQNLLDAMTYAEGLKQDDQNSLDLDKREGHLVLLEEKFEYHPESGYVHKSGDVQTAGDDRTVRTTQVKDGYHFRDQQGVWDKENGTFEFQFKTRPEDTWGGGGGKSLVAQGEFKVSSAGEVELPSASSLEEAATVAPAHKNAQRAEELLEAGQFWLSTGQTFDQGTGDLNPAEGAVVAPGVSREELLAKGLQGEMALSQAFEWIGERHDEEFEYQSFDLQARPGQALVMGSDNSQRRPYGASLHTERDKNGLMVVLERPEHSITEKAMWNFGDGTVKYEKLQDG